MNAIQWITFDLTDVGLISADIIDVWTSDDLGTVNVSYAASVEVHGALVYQLSNTALATPYQYTTYPASASSNVLEGGATP